MMLDDQKIIEKISELRNEAGLKLENKQALKMRILQSILDVRVAQNARHTRRSIFNFKPMPIFASLAVMAILSGGVSYAAQSSLPGDFLYTVKVNVNESVRSALAVGSESQAHWEIERARLRLQEASELADKGRELDEEEEARLESRFSASADAALKESTELQTEGDRDSADAIASELESVLRVQTKVMANVKAMAKLRASANKRLNAAIKVRGEAELDGRADRKASTESREAAQGKIKSARNIIKEVKSFLEKNRDRIDVEVYTGAESRLIVAEEMLVDADAKFEAEMYNEAFIIASKSARLAQEVKAFVTASIRLPSVKIELNGSLEGSTSKELDDLEHGEQEEEKREKNELEDRTNGSLELDL